MWLMAGKKLTYIININNNKNGDYYLNYIFYISNK